MNKTKSFIKNHSLFISVSFTWFLILLTRLAYYLYINVPFLFDDSHGYNVITNQLVTGNTLLFTLRLPVYPLFLAIPHIFTKNIDFVIYLQTIASLLTAFFFIWAVNKTFKNLTIVAGIAVSAFMTSLIALHNETAVLPESLYTNFLLIFTGFLFLSIKKPKTKYYLGLSIAFTISFLIRPTALFLTPIVLFIAFFIIYNKIGKKYLLYLLLPPIIFSLSLAIYNKKTIGIFVFSNRGVMEIGPVITFTETDESLPDYMNESIEKRILAKTNKQEVDIIDTTWDLINITILYLNYQTFKSDFIQDLEKVHKGDLKLTMDDCSLFFSTMVKKHPDKYLKFLSVGFLHYFNSIHRDKTAAFPYYRDYYTCFQEARVQNYFYKDSNKRAYYYSFDIPQLSPSLADNKIKDIEKKPLSRFTASFFSIHQYLFRNYLWLVLYIIVFIGAIVRFFKKRMKDEDSFIVLNIALMNLLHLMVILIASPSFIRYNQTLHFTYYILPFLIPLLIPGFSLKELFSARKIALASSGQTDKNINIKRKYKTKKKSQAFNKKYKR